MSALLLTPQRNIDDYYARQRHRPARALLSQATPALPETRVTNLKNHKGRNIQGFRQTKGRGADKETSPPWPTQNLER